MLPINFLSALARLLYYFQLLREIPNHLPLLLQQLLLMVIVLL